MLGDIHLQKARFSPLSSIDWARIAWILRLATAGALIGHGGYGAVMAKAAWVDYFGVLGIDVATVQAASLVALVGWIEIALGVAVLYKPIRGLLLGIVVWKMATEFLRPLADEPMWEFIERASNMIAPFALIYVLGWPRSLREWLR
jgi:hypothetical protein